MDFRNWDINRLRQYYDGIRTNASKQHVRKEIECEFAWREHRAWLDQHDNQAVGMSTRTKAA